MNYEWELNGGLIIIEPSHQLFDDMIKYAKVSFPRKMVFSRNFLSKKLENSVHFSVFTFARSREIHYDYTFYLFLSYGAAAKTCFCAVKPLYKSNNDSALVVI